MIVGIGEETKGYRVYLPKDRVVITPQHVKNIETLDKAQKEQVQRLYLREEDSGDLDASAGETGNAAEAVDKESGGVATGRKRSGNRRSKKKTWQREPHVTRSAAKRAAKKTAEKADEPVQQEEEARINVVNSVVEADPRNYDEAMRSKHKDQWIEAMNEELSALEENGFWKVVRLLWGAHVLYTKWVYKTKTDAHGDLERRKARVVACGNEQQLGVDYCVTFAAVIDMSGVKLLLALARKWRVPAKHGDVPNAYVKADKEAELVIYIRVPQRMGI
ncbi:putative mitochondrial protein [Phytophthora megakarya]|uniref:Putative mitochondrial protein n=1 Tax=Phytophthora megakarya TaxID=4795 RepID=A0A225ULY7_9STRA|nr:putative mitochondrial protein [Phytophthora megakarya]